jgi:hypothetical protein
MKEEAMDKQIPVEVISELEWRHKNYWKEPFKSKAFIKWYWREYYMTEEEKDKEYRNFLIFVFLSIGTYFSSFIGCLIYILIKFN